MRARAVRPGTRPGTWAVHAAVHGAVNGAIVSAVAGGVVVAGYAYLGTGWRPFTTPSYLAVAVPVLLVGALVSVASRGSARPAVEPIAAKTVSARRSWPWMVLAVAMIALETLGLALGGRSSAVPTLSTVLDHALAWHLARAALFAGWLAVGLVAAVRVARRSRR